ncbi:MAG TPA: caspase family protein, partial [Gemmataceae bacterium]
MRYWLSSTLLIGIVLAFGCSRHEEPQPRTATESPNAQTTRTIPVSDAGKENDDEAGGRAPAPGKESGRKRALLIGCTKYDKLPERAHLKGPSNDVELMREVLTERFGFADKDIVTLTERPEAAGRPTRANIKSQFERLAKEARPGDQVMILLSGHGNQQPDHEPLDEPDGLDETFLPCDCGPWDADKEMVLNAILDDELEAWSKAITDGGAALFLIFDCCHSGTMLRGGNHVLREIPPGELVPKEALQKAGEAAAGRRVSTRGAAAKAPAAKAANKVPRLVALYASQPHEPTIELPMPPDDVRNDRYGLLTYTVCQLVTKSQSPLTYRELAQRLQGQYVQWGLVSPTPLLEGLDQDREILGTRAWPGRSQFFLHKSDEDDWKIRAGQLHGLTENSILAVYPPAGKAGADKIAGHVRVRKSLPTESEVEPCAYNKLPAPKELIEGGRCELVYVDYGALRLRVGIEKSDNAEDDNRQRVRQTLKEIAKVPDSLVELADDGQKADVLARIKGDKIYLVSAAVAQRIGEPPPGAAYFGPYSAEQVEKMQDDLTRIARARNLLKLVSGASDSAAEDLEIEMVKLKDKNDKKGEPLKWGAKGLVLQPGDWVSWRVSNRGLMTLDVTLLFIDSGYGIAPLFPR